MEKTTAAMAEFNNKADSITTEKQQFNDMLDGNTKVMLQTLRTRLQTNPEEGMKAISRAFKEILGEELAN
jgi:glutamyl-tRNA reductase